MTTTGDAGVDALVADWLSLDRNAATRAEIERLAAAGDVAELRARLGSRMAFGTAGLRAAMGAGYSRMNELTVIQASQGLCAHVLTTFGAGASVVVGYDARHHSRSFAERTAVAFAQRGVRVHLFSGICPTPYLAFAVTHLQCAAGVMVTASHNPKDDNGYKVYWNNGAQIIGPTDAHIAAQIAANLVPWDGAWDSTLLAQCADPAAEIHAAYQAYIAGVRAEGFALPAAPHPGIVYTAMHGVGHKFVEASFVTAGLPPMIPTAEQVVPDPDFPTVEYPNPEEGKGALNLAIATAEKNGATVILANDPDADRLAVAAKHHGEWRIFTGNEIGALLGAHCWARFRARRPDADPRKCAMLSSSVSSMVLRTIAAAEGFHFEDTLTGFKWMGNRARQLQAEGYEVLFAFEEAIGFAVGGRVVDKDGVSAAVVLAELALLAHANGRTLVDELDNVFLRYGHHCSKVSYYICHEPATIREIFGRVRENAAYPTSFGPYAVRAVRDVTTGFDSREADRVCKWPKQSGQMVTFYLENAVVTLRTSGTEPKIKYYAEIILPPRTDGTPSDAAAAMKELEAQIHEVVEAVLRPAHYHLQAKKE